MDTLPKLEQTILQAWEETYKKSQLTLWILLALKDNPKHMSEIKQFIIRMHGESLAADNQSMYRALRRFKDAQLITFTLRAGRKGPDLKQYFLTSTGRTVLQAFLDRNIIPVLYSQTVEKLIKTDQ